MNTGSGISNYRRGTVLGTYEFLYLINTKLTTYTSTKDHLSALNPDWIKTLFYSSHSFRKSRTITDLHEHGKLITCAYTHKAKLLAHHFLRTHSDSERPWAYTLCYFVVHYTAQTSVTLLGTWQSVQLGSSKFFPQWLKLPKPARVTRFEERNRLFSDYFFYACEFMFVRLFVSATSITRDA